MEIKGLANAISAYKFNSYDKAAKAVKTTSTNIRNKDIVEISSRKNNVNALKSNIANSVKSSASPEKIANIKQMINDGSYYIPTETILKSIID